MASGRRRTLSAGLQDVRRQRVEKRHGPERSGLAKEGRGVPSGRRALQGEREAGWGGFWEQLLISRTEQWIGSFVSLLAFSS